MNKWSSDLQVMKYEEVLPSFEMPEPIIIDGKAGKSVQGTKTPVDKTAS